MQASESGDMPRGSMVVDAGTDQPQGAKTSLVSLHGDDVACGHSRRVVLPFVPFIS